MDTTLKLKLTDLGKAIKTLKIVLTKDFEQDPILRDAAIQRFEYTFELSWKTGKHYLNKNLGIVTNSPKEVFRSLQQQNILSPTETALSLNMVDDRNNSTHTYNENFAITLAKKIPAYFDLFQKIELKIKNTV
jgi:nucleotidyltransferase substrate binding protein (TIGR01987 family)